MEERDKQLAIEHVLISHSVTKLNLIALLSTSGRVLKVGLLLFSVGKCRTGKVNKDLSSGSLLNCRNPRRKIFNYETWVFTYDPETKLQSMQWKSTSSPRPKKARMSLSKFKDMLIVFFDIQGIVMTVWVPRGQTVN